MARVKYHPGVIPLVNQHFGFDFQPHSSGQSITVSKKNDRFRNINQSGSQQNLMRAIRNWRNMSTEIKAAWTLFAATFPQASRRNPAIFLTGYQLFLKRSHYCFLNQGITSDFMEAPALSELPTPEIEFVVADNKNTMDVTELYIKNFGILPVVGQYILIRIFPMAVASGQFFSPLEATVLVEQVYLDGLFVSFNFPVAPGSVVFSVYLSKVFHQSIKYIGTKVRYMGCFTPKTFLELTDTPASYAGQGLKIPFVKVDESGIDFKDEGGGGINCDDLLDCGIIQQMISQIEANSIIISQEFGTSVPAVTLGLLYNSYVLYHASEIAPPGCELPSRVEMLALISFLGGTSVAGGLVKETGVINWLSPNTGATNIKKMNMRGAGVRLLTGVFDLFHEYSRCWTSTPYYGQSAYIWQLTYSNTEMRVPGSAHAKTGLPIRAKKIVTTLSEGESGIVVGNSGIVYRTIVIGGIEWLADNLRENFFQDGSECLEVSDNLEWSVLTSPGLCAYDNDWANV